MIALLWTLPTVGLLVSSFRPPEAIGATGWWTSLVPPFDFTLDSYVQVLTTNNMWPSFLNSLFIGYGLPFAVYLLRSFFAGLPKDLFEVAEVDGATASTVFFRLLLPTSVPAIASLAIFQFLWVWNDLLVVLIYLGGNPSVAPMTVTVSNLVNSLGQNWQLLTAAAFVSMVLPLVVFFSLQRHFVTGILAGSVKG